ncbi:YihY family inner membrane protein [Motiliproteus sp. SC1-56]|uniref:YihY family inner membrane protein n=1 Tax=Motiliproteus sp. SC1-56 TaxID=2799565 RepID=UPI001A8E0134|nr:YihY family inner membrane protein [Motiliproteus sp. SC1-56]
MGAKGFESNPVIAGWHFLRYLLTEFNANHGGLNAAALTYTTLFAVVPLMTVTYAMLSSIPTFQGVSMQLETLIFNHFVPASGLAVKEYLSGFANQARTLTALGIGVLVVTAYLMLKTIESAFNRIWRVRSHRRGLSSFLLYWAVLSLGPLLLGLGFVLTSYLVSLPLISDATAVLGGRERWLGLVTLATSVGAFTLIYAAVPNCRVPVPHAFVGALVVSVLFEAAKRAFTLFVTHFPSYELIYGAFAAFPLFLAWIYISWLIILLGAELVRAQSTYRGQRHARQYSHLRWVLGLLEVLWENYPLGRGVGRDELLKRLPGLETLALDDYLELLVDQRLVAKTDQGTVVLCRDPRAISVQELWRACPWPLPAALGEGLSKPWQIELDRQLRSLEQQREDALATSLDGLYSVRATGVSNSSIGKERV